MKGEHSISYYRADEFCDILLLDIKSFVHVYPFSILVLVNLYYLEDQK